MSYTCLYPVTMTIKIEAPRVPVMRWVNNWRTPLPGGAKGGDIHWIIAHVHVSVKNEKTEI